MKRVVVVGGGISGLATAYRIVEGAKALGLPLTLTVLEGEPRVGGKIVTERREGFTVEGGPNGFLDGKPETLRLARDVGLGDALLPSSDAARRRFVFRHGALHALPESPPAFFRSRLMSVPGRLRIIAEPFIRPAPPELDESLAEFGTRRLGAEAVDALLDPMVSGVYAGDPQRLSVWACFPRIKELERDHGSLIRALFAVQRQHRKALASGRQVAAAGGPGGPSGKLTSFKEGTQLLVDRLHDKLGASVRVGTPARSITGAAGGGYQVRLDGGGALDADAVVLACPAYSAAELLETMAPESARAAREIPYAPAVVVALGFERAAVANPLDGFGFLIPKSERRRILGSLWTSSIYPGHRAPDGRILLRTIVGGARNPELTGLPEDELVALVRAELESILGIDATPVFREVFRWPVAIPQYNVGHRERVRRIDEGLLPHPRLVLTGNAYRGVGINDCTREAELAASKVLATFPTGAA
jgi:oxygen-dependent protoporphyrinogen oxidase